MKTLTACFLLSVIGLSYATARWPYNYRFGISNYNDKNTAAALLESLSSLQLYPYAESEENDISDLQGVFNVLAQIETEKAKVIDDESATAQFWKSLRKTAVNLGKHYFRSKYCSEEKELEGMLEKQSNEQGMSDSEDTEEGDGKAITELQTLFSALKKVEAKLMQDGGDTEKRTAVTQGWFKKLRKGLKKGIKNVARGYLC